MTQCWTRDLCIWHYTWWRNVGLVICVSGIIQNDVGLVICASDIIQNDAMLDSWSVYLTLYRMTPCWTCDLCIWHYTEWLHVGLVIVYLTLYRMTPWDHESNIILYNVRYIGHESNMASFCKCQIHRPRVQHGVILYNVRYRSRVQHCVIMYNVRYTDHESNIASSCIMSDTQITSPTLRHHV